jgi:hypothetical protein
LKIKPLALHDPNHDYGHVYSHVHVYVYVYIYTINLQVDRLNPVNTSESSNSRPKGFSVTRGQGDPWSMLYQIATTEGS